MTDRPTNQPKHGLGMHRELTLPITNLLRPVAPLHITDYASSLLVSPLKILNVIIARKGYLMSLIYWEDGISQAALLLVNV